jgi:hypothetical protein
MNPTPGDVHVNTPLTNISVAYLQRQEAFIADRVFPNIPVPKQSDRYYTYDRGMFNRDQMRKRAPGTETAGIHYTVDNTPTYFADLWGVHHDVPDQRRANADNVLDPDREATELVTHQALIRREAEWASNYFTTGVWTTDLTGVTGAPGAGEFQYWNEADSTPIEVIRSGVATVLKSTGFKPNTLVLGYEVFNALIDHGDIVDRVKYGQTAPGPAMVDTGELSAIFKIPRVFVAEAIENTAAEGATNVHDFIIGKSALLCYSTPTPGIMTPTAGYTFSWTGMVGLTNAGMRIKRFRIEKEGSDRVEMEMAFDHKLVSADLGYFFDGAVA